MIVYGIEGNDEIFFTSRELAERYIEIKKIRIDNGDSPETDARVIDVEIFDHLPKELRAYKAFLEIKSDSRTPTEKKCILGEIKTITYFEDDCPPWELKYCGKGVSEDHYFWGNSSPREVKQSDGYYYKVYTNIYSAADYTVEEVAKSIAEFCKKLGFDILYLGNYNELMRQVVQEVQKHDIKCITGKD